MSVTNDKIADLSPRWAPFRGFSILFDNPGNSLLPPWRGGPGRGPTTSGAVQTLACDIEDPAQAFYKAVSDCADAIGNSATADMTLCLLPPPSYHVTVWDGINAGNVDRIAVDKRAQASHLLDGFPDSIASTSSTLDLPQSSPLITKRDWNLSLQLANIDIWSNAIVASLLPAPSSIDAFQNLIDERRDLGDRFLDQFHRDTYHPYTAHVTIGYFGNKPGRDLAVTKLHEWKLIGDQLLNGLTLDFDSASIYGFTDMVTFFRRVPR